MHFEQMLSDQMGAGVWEGDWEGVFAWSRGSWRKGLAQEGGWIPLGG